MAAPYLVPSDIAAARAINAEMRECLTDFDPKRFTALNHDFHSVIFEHCTNLHILDLVHRGWNRLATIRESMFTYIPGRALSSVDEHDHLLELIESCADPLTIELAARGHRLATLHEFLDKTASSPALSPFQPHP
jgi:DNA-binding GntR family transcriptional regulator